MSHRVLAVLALVAGVVAGCNDGGATPLDPFGAHCDQYGPDFSEPLDSAGNLVRRTDCGADSECRPQMGREAWDDGLGWCHANELDYVACIPDVLADPGVCTPSPTSLPGGPTWGRPSTAPGACFRLDTPCMPEGWSDCPDATVTQSQVCP
jgi:hypothetical protein